MDKGEKILAQAREFCWVLYGVRYDDLELHSFPRIASYYVAREFLEGNEDIFASLRKITDAIHRYNRNIIVSMVAHNEPIDAAEKIASRGIIVREGRDPYEQITGKSSPEGFDGKRRADESWERSQGESEFPDLEP